MEETAPQQIAPRTPTDHRERGRLRYSAEKRIEPTFIAVCAQHGETLYDVKSGGCFSCLAQPTDLPVRVHYLSAGAFFYPAICGTCQAERMHYLTTNQCSRCFDAWGRTRWRETNHSRREARAKGWSKYADKCELHGLTDFWTQAGRCVLCYTASGIARARHVGASSARILARQAGAPTYVGPPCPDCGKTKRGVRYGHCLNCFTVDGIRRRKK